MGRAGLMLVVFLGASAWAGAQGTAPGLTAADRLRLLRANRAVLNDLVGSGVELAGADDPLDRAAACGKTVRALGVAFRAAAESGDADRAADLGDHLSTAVRDGLVPALDDARRVIPDGSPRAPELKALRAKAAAEVGEYRAAVPAAGRVADSPKVKAARDQLDGLREKLK